MYSRFCLGLRRFLKEKITFVDARQIIKERLEQREENFLKIMKRGIFEYKKSPYLPLLKLSKYEYRDIEKLVFKCGLEETLKILKEDGVYYTIEEFKGKKAAIRKGEKFIVKEKDFDNPYIAPSYERRSSGSRRAGTRVMADFDFLSKVAIHNGFIIDLWNLSKAPFIILRAAFPYSPGISGTLRFSKFGIYPISWISLIEENNIPLSLKSKLGVFYILFMGKIFGAKFPWPKFVNLKDIPKVLVFIKNVLREYRECCIFANISSSIRICLAAKEMGIDLSGVKFHGGGEPLTLTRRNEIESSGAKFILNYAFTEVGLAGSLCPHASSVDDIHLFKDFLALISYHREVRDSYINAFLFTTLLVSSPKILLNVENGDYGIIETKRCGCPYEDIGLNTHIHNIRSFEKLTGEGMTFYGTDLIRLIEEILPAKFGGNSLDYQLVEEEDERGIIHLIVFVSPKVGSIDERSFIKTIHDELKKGGDSQKVMTEVWSQAGTIKVKRNYPILTKTNKLYPLFILPGR